MVADVVAKRIAFFDSKSYDKVWFDRLNTRYEVTYFEARLGSDTVRLAQGYDVVCAFVNDDINSAIIDVLYEFGIKLIALRCAGYDNVDLKAAFGKIRVVYVPSYSPHAVAEHAMALLQTLNRKIHKAYNRTREFNFSLEGLIGTGLRQKIVGVIGTGRIGRAFIDICRGYGMRVIAYDPTAQGVDIEYMPLERLLEESDVISLHCALTEQTHHMLDEKAFNMMKRGVFVINTSRGSLIDSIALLNALDDGVVRGAGLDVYERETQYFFENCSDEIIRDQILSLLLSKPNVILTSHQAFLTDEALANIASTTLNNMDEFFEGRPLENEISCQHSSNSMGQQKWEGPCKKV